jgi:hypothetical protein
MYKEKLGMIGEWWITQRDPQGNIVSCNYYCNVITTVAKTLITQAFASDLTALSDIELNYQELGTGVTPPAAGDTGLETPDAGTRKLLASAASSLNQLNVTAFWAAGEATGTWTEYGTFSNGTAASNSGTMFNHVAISETVGASNSLSVDGTITFT